MGIGKGGKKGKKGKGKKGGFNDYNDYNDGSKANGSSSASNLPSKMSEEEKTALRSAAAEAVRKTSKEGSKLEKFLLNKIRESGVLSRSPCRKSLVAYNLIQCTLNMPFEREKSFWAILYSLML